MRLTRDRYNTKRYIVERHPYRGKDPRDTVRVIVTVLLGALLLAAVIFGALLAVVLTGSHDEIKGEPKVMIVLGCQVKSWGPSTLLQDRLDTALYYWKEHPDTTIVASGGQGPDEHISEAKAMRDFFVEQGVPEELVLMEDESHNTIQNLEYSAQLLRDKGFDPAGDVLIVSNGFHLARVRMLWGRVAGSTEHLSTLAAPSSHLPSRLKMYVREPFGLIKSFLLDR